MSDPVQLLTIAQLTLSLPGQRKAYKVETPYTELGVEWIVWADCDGQTGKMSLFPVYRSRMVWQAALYLFVSCKIESEYIWNNYSITGYLSLRLPFRTLALRVKSCDMN